jgi:hypothetical protein
MLRTWFKRHPRRALVYGAGLLLVSFEIICVTAGSPPIWVLVTAVAMAASALGCVAWLAWRRMAVGPLVRPWAGIPEMAHLAPKDRRAFWRYCRDHGLAPITSMDIWRASIPVCVYGALSLPLIVLDMVSPGRYRGLLFIVLSLFPAVLLLQWATMMRFHRLRIRRSISRDVLARFLGRQLPSSLRAVRCPRCDYNLVAKPEDSAFCPECGLSLVEPPA